MLYLAMATLSLVIDSVVYIKVEVGAAHREAQKSAEVDEPKHSGWRMTATAIVAAILAVDTFCYGESSLYRATASLFALFPMRYAFGAKPPSNLIAQLIVRIVTYLESLARCLALFVCCACGLWVEYYFYGFLLFDIMYQSDILSNVLKAVTTCASQLAYTGMLIVVTIFVFGLIAFFWFGDDFLSFKLENGLLSFFFTTAYDVMVPGPALSVGNEKQFHLRFAFDMAFYLIIGVVLLNLVFGIIIDTFAALRTETQNRQDYFAGNCFVCGIAASTIDNAARQRGVPGFIHHIFEEHCMWDYMYFIFLVRSKDVTTLSGPEQRILQLMDKNDVSWFPTDRALLLEGRDREEELQETGMHHMLNTLTAQQSTLAGQVEGLTDRMDEMVGMLANMRQEMKKEDDDDEEDFEGLGEATRTVQMRTLFRWQTTEAARNVSLPQLKPA